MMCLVTNSLSTQLANLNVSTAEFLSNHSPGKLGHHRESIGPRELSKNQGNSGERKSCYSGKQFIVKLTFGATLMFSSNGGSILDAVFFGALQYCYTD